MWDKTTTLARHPKNFGEKSAIGTSKPSPELKVLLDTETKAAFYTATAASFCREWQGASMFIASPP